MMGEDKGAGIDMMDPLICEILCCERTAGEQ